jgi:hypothetical protein
MIRGTHTVVLFDVPTTSAGVWISAVLFAFLVAAVHQSKAQKDEAIIVPTNLTFYLPYRDGTPEIRTNLLRATYAVDILDESGKYLRTGKVETASTKPNPTSDARSFMFRIAERFPEPARFRIVKRFSGVDETNRPVKETRSWDVVVTHPTLSAPVSVDSIYFFGESAYISFGTVQYPEHPLYSYRIETEQGMLQDSGRGTTIDLRATLRDPRCVGKGFVAKGMYDGRPFRCINPRTSQVEETVWRFRVAAPTLSPVSIPWAEPGERMTPVLSMGLPSRYDPNVFSYVYVDTRDTSSYVVSTPDIENLRVVSIPSGFVQSYHAQPAGVFSQIVIVPNKALLGKEGLLVTLFFRFEDSRLRVPYEKRYRALVFQ